MISYVNTHLVQEITGATLRYFMNGTAEGSVEGSAVVMPVIPHQQAASELGVEYVLCFYPLPERSGSAAPH